MKKPRFLCDCDGVLADFTGAALLAAGRITGILYERAQVTEWDILKAIGLSHHDRYLAYELMMRRGFSKGLEVLPGAQAAINKLRNSTDFYVVTTPMIGSRTWPFDREVWLQEQLGIEHYRVIHTYDKRPIDGTWLLDDKVENVVGWQNEGPGRKGILWERSWNKHQQYDGMKVDCWEEVFEIVAGL